MKISAFPHFTFSFAAFVLLAVLVRPVLAQKKDDQPGPRTEEQILKTVKLPQGYDATVFAMPPIGGYPTSVSAAIDGTIFVAIDENGSLGRDRNPAEGIAGPKDGRIPGKVVRLRDTDGDGKADESKTFCEVESPRGVIWDGNGMGADGKMPGTLYVMHPPNLTAYTDTDGDGKSDKQEDILTGLGFDLAFRGADHTTNGARLAIDGFIYIAVGDYGFINAKAKDGTTLTNRGGGIVRIRPDGTGFEIVSRGQRNIYDVAVSPTLDLFTRDNTNDGGGWNVRLSFVPPGAQMGYPHLFKNFAEDIFQPLFDYGGGSPCGALWIDEPGLQNGLYTVEWGRNAIMFHPMKQKGAGWEVAPSPLDTDPKLPGQQEWLKLTRPTDMDVDASGAIFITSWEGATFNYNGPNAGYVLRVVKSGKPKVEVPDLAKMKPRELVKLTASDGAVVRQAAQRELLRKFDGKPDADLARAAFASANDRKDQQHFGAAYSAFLTGVALVPRSDFNADRVVTAFKADKVEQALMIIRAYGSTPRNEAAPLFVAGLHEADPRIRAAAITALRRLGSAGFQPAASGILPASREDVPGKMPETAGRMPALPGSILPLVADSDAVISHLAIRALSELRAIELCLAALDSSDDKVKPGALQSLYGIYDPAVVDGLIQRLEKGSAGFQPAAAGILPAPSGEGATNPSGKMPEGAGRMPALPNPWASADGSFHLRRGLLNALCRLANEDAPYTDPKVWWGTRPDTSGPVYQPIAWSETPKITAALQTALAASNEEDAKWLVARMYATKVAYPGLVELMLAKAGTDTAAKLNALESMISSDNILAAAGLAAAVTIAERAEEAPELRARALRLLQRANQQKVGVEPLRIAALEAAIAAFSPLAGRPLPHPALTAAFEDFTRAVPAMNNLYAYENLALGADARQRTLAQTILVNLATSTVAKGREKEYAQKAVEKLWKKPEVTASLLGVVAQTKAKAFADQVKAQLKAPDNAVAEAALFAYQALGLTDDAALPTIGALKYEAVFAAVQKGGDAKAGQEMFLRAGCIACHTVQADEPPKGPILSAVAKIYDRAALTESILKPNAKMAQGFESAWIKTKKGEQLEGFVTREGGDNLDLRNIAGQTVLVEKADIAERGHREISMMPEGLLNAFTPAELANLLAWMESLKK